MKHNALNLAAAKGRTFWVLVHPGNQLGSVHFDRAKVEWMHGLVPGAAYALKIKPRV
jgi:hypothetical protein